MISVVVKRKTLEADNIVSFELEAENGEALPRFSAGAHVDVQLGDGLTRQYSLVNSCQENHRYMLGVLLDSNSRGGSKYMHENVIVGSKLQISEPRNLFSLAHDAKRSLLFAGGIGITPILCMAERLAHVDADFELHYCARTQNSMAFVDYLKESSFSDRVHFHFDDGLPEQLLATAQVLASPNTDKHLYVCGPGGFMDHVLGEAETMGWSSECMHREYFSAQVDEAATSEGFEVKLASTGQVFQIPEEKSVADVLINAGIDIPVSCEQGVCGTCLTRVLEGQPDHRDMFLTDDEHEKNDQFTPCCSRSKSAVLVLDI
jgi:vanillate O-demethylase ferredoxin subunit